MRAHEFITEFGFSSESPKARITQEEIESANIVGRIDGRDICELSNNEVSLFFFKNESQNWGTNFKVNPGPFIFVFFVFFCG